MQRLVSNLHEVVRQIGDAPTPAQSAPSSGPNEAPASFLEEVLALLMEDLAKVVFKGLADPAEACREASIKAVALFMEHVPDLTPHLAYLFPVLMARAVPAGSLYDPSLELFVHDNDEHEAYKRGRATERQDQHLPQVQHIAEGSEELRLSLCRMVGRMLGKLMDRGTIGVLRPYLDDTILLLVSQFRDPYSAVKVEALSIVTTLVLHPHVEQGMKFYAVGISRAILPHLRHRHAKVRLAAIKALRLAVMVPDRAKVKGAGTSAIVDLVGFREDNVLPIAAFYGRGDTTVNYLAELTTDRSVSVRAETTAMLSDWLTSLPDRYDHQTRLLPYVLNAIADEAEVVSTVAVETLSKCGAEYEREHQDDIIERRQFGVDGDIRANHTKPLPHPFPGRPRIGARLYVRGNTRRFLMPLLAEMSNWISKTRLQSALLFRTLVVYCEEHLTVETHKLIPHLQRALRLATNEKDHLLEDIILDCCELVGRYVVPESYLPHMLSRIKEEPEVDPTGSRATLLSILWKFMEGALPKVLVPHTSDIVDAVTARYEDIAGEPVRVRGATIKALSVAASAMAGLGRQAVEEATFATTGRLSSTGRPIKSALTYLLGCRGLTGCSLAEVDLVLSSLAEACGLASVESLVTAHAEELAAGASSIVNKIENFPDGNQEEVLATFVGALVLRTAQVWEYGEGSVQAERNGKSQEHAARCMLKLGLNTCWSKTPLLRHRQMEMITTFMDNKSWCQVLSTCSSQAELPVEDMMAAVVGLLDHPQAQHQECCQAITLVSQLLKVSSCSSSDQHAHSRQVIPFSQSDKLEELECSVMAASAFPSILSRLDDSSSDDVRRIAVEVLADFLPFVQPDGSCGEGTRPAAQKGESDASSAANDADSERTKLLQFGLFVEKCVMYATNVVSAESELMDELDTLLRRAACLDPNAFISILARLSETSGLSKAARQWISNLADHGSVLTMLRVS
ncbi:conserved unknown protein [Ectocarpus siliculosus]|uniref:Uncharacterized protein n=1 Tax=Ectocarpus siliculosus TaxID=2880 RepID=D8LFZ5_ECTSI|nr:conserved unknown protein [Ectocarpus siliculosus]|eukprot:CBN78894.1 conserved unknown protein [Ectocarpus siliculosus]